MCSSCTLPNRPRLSLLLPAAAWLRVQHPSPLGASPPVDLRQLHSPLAALHDAPGQLLAVGVVEQQAVALQVVWDLRRRRGRGGQVEQGTQRCASTLLPTTNPDQTGCTCSASDGHGSCRWSACRAATSSERAAGKGWWPPQRNARAGPHVFQADSQCRIWPAPCSCCCSNISALRCTTTRRSTETLPPGV